jgi:hypothetical protein
MTSRPENTPAAGEISLSASTYLELGLAALADGDIPRAAGCLAAIDARSWAAVLDRFPGLPLLLTPRTDAGPAAAPPAIRP